MANGFNFAKRPFTNERLPRLVFTCAVIFVVLVSVVHAVLLTRSLLREQEELDSRVAELRGDLESTTEAIAEAQGRLARNQTALADEKARFLTRLYHRKSFAWTALFNELETITPARVRVTSIAPSEENGEISVTMNIVGKSLEDVLEMVRRLEASSLFDTVFPVDETILDARTGDTGIAATLRLAYVDPAIRAAAAAPASGTSAEEASE